MTALCARKDKTTRELSFRTELDCNTPLVLSFDQRPVTLVADPLHAFDLSGRESHATDWPTADTPWLALDRDGNGTIDDGTELFGSMTPAASGMVATNGFIALDAFDDDHDGAITRRDAAFARLVLWGDENADRVSQPGELRSLASAGIVSMNLAYTSEPRCDDRGNCEVERARFQFVDASSAAREGDVVDVHIGFPVRYPSPVRGLRPTAVALSLAAFSCGRDVRIEPSDPPPPDAAGGASASSSAAATTSVSTSVSTSATTTSATATSTAATTSATGVGGGPPDGDLLATGLDNPTFLAVVGDHLYVTESSRSPTAGRLSRVLKAGGPVEHLVEGLNHPWQLVAQSDGVAWVNFGTGSGDGAVMRWPFGASSAETLVSGWNTPWALATIGSDLFTVDETSTTAYAIHPDHTTEAIDAPLRAWTPMAAADGELYFGVHTDTNAQTAILRARHADGTSSDLVVTPGLPTVITVDGSDLYFVSWTSLYRTTTAGGPVVEVAKLGSMVFDLEVLDGYVYAPLYDLGEIVRVSVSSGVMEVREIGLGEPCALAHDDTYLYWSNRIDGTLRRALR